jgi:hypothetical protein
MTNLFWFHQFQVQVLIAIMQKQHSTLFTFQAACKISASSHEIIYHTFRLEARTTFNQVHLRNIIEGVMTGLACSRRKPISGPKLGA